jgi:hypothetical protein
MIPLLWASLRLRTTLALGVVFVLVTKPAPVGALSTMAVAVAWQLPPALVAGFVPGGKGRLLQPI